MGNNHPAWQLAARPRWKDLYLQVKRTTKTGKPAEKCMTTCHPDHPWFKWPLQPSICCRGPPNMPDSLLIFPHNVATIHRQTPSSLTEYITCNARWDILLLRHLQRNIGCSYVRPSERPPGVTAIHLIYPQLASWTRKLKGHLDLIAYSKKHSPRSRVKELKHAVKEDVSHISQGEVFLLYVLGQNLKEILKLLNINII